MIAGKPAVQYILLQEQRINDCKKQIDREASRSATKYLNEIQKAFKEFKGSDMILMEPNLDNFTNAHLCNILLAYYAGRFTLLIRDYTFVSRLMPGSVLLAGYMEELKHIGIIQEGIKPRKVEAHAILVQKLANADTKFLKRILIDFMISCAKESKRVLKVVGEEVMRCRTDPKRRNKIQDYELQDEAMKVFEYEPLPDQEEKEENKEEEEEHANEEEEEEQENGAELEERADFKACIDLFVGAQSEPKEAKVDDNALTYVPEEAVDFESLGNMVKEEFATVRKELKPFFIAKLIQGVTMKMDRPFFKELTKPYRKPKQQAK